MMRLAFLLPDLRAGGAERVSLDLAKTLSGLGHGVELVLMRAEGELLAEAEAQFPVTELGVDRVRNVPLTLARYLRQRRPAAVLAAMWPLTVAAPLARAISGRRCVVVVSEHNALSRQYRDRGLFHRLLLRLSLAAGHRLADARVGVSSGVAEDMSRLAWLDPGSANVIHNPIPTPIAPSADALTHANALWGVDRGARILSVGSFKPQKDHALMLRAFARLELRHARLMLVGAGAGETGLRSLARDLGIDNRVVFAGFRPEPSAFYLTADLFVLSSNHEGLANVLIEALACGLPVVSTDCPFGPAEILENGRWGRLAPVGDVEALASAMREALSAQHDREALKRRAADFAPAIAAEKYLDLLLPDRHTAPAPRSRNA